MRRSQVQTLMSVDADRVVNLANSFFDLWSIPIQIAMALWLLYKQARPPCGSSNSSTSGCGRCPCCPAPRWPRGSQALLPSRRGRAC